MTTLNWVVTLMIAVLLSTDPLHASTSIDKKVDMWLGIRQNPHQFSAHDITTFVEAHPHWPSHKEFCEKVEAVLAKSGSDQECINWFTKHPPQTAAGAMAYAHALQAPSKITSIVRTAWSTLHFTQAEETKFLKSFKRYLPADAHHDRLHFCVWNGHHDHVKRLSPHLSADMQQVAAVSLAFMQDQPDASQKLRTLPARLHQNEGLLHAVAAWHKKHKNVGEAARILAAVCPRSESAEHWWKTRNYIARELIGLKDYSGAYQVVASHNLKAGGEDFASAEWLCGWLALRFLNCPQEALCHFQKVANNVNGAISKSRALYWLGRTYEHVGDLEKAAQAYGQAARYKTVYYGQLAAAKLQDKAYPSLRALKVTPQDKARFNQQDLVKAAHVLKKRGKACEPELRQFLIQIGANATTPGEKDLAVHLAHTLSPPSVVWVARKAGHADPLHLKLAFPTCSVPCTGPEDAFVMAIAYQETRFDPTAVSNKEAKGLLQLLSSTAAREAKRLGIPHSEKKIFDPKHNMRLGASHISSLLKDFDGSYLLVAIAYNAGPHVASRWVTERGDPRDPRIDVIDWIELIPYAETRNYVQRVLETTTVYRCVNGTPQYTLVDDLQRRGA